MANEEKRDSAPLAQTSNGYRIAVNVITLIVVIIASFAAGFAVSTLVQSGQKDQGMRPDFNQQNWPTNPGGNGSRNRPQKETQPDTSTNNS